MLIVMIFAGCYGLHASSNDQLKAMRRNVSQSFLGDVYGQVNHGRSESRTVDLEELSRLIDGQDGLETIRQEEAFRESPEVNKARFALKADLPEEIALRTIQRAFASSPTLNATGEFMNELDRIYYHNTPRVIKLQEDIRDGSRKAAQRYDSQCELDKFRSIPPFYENCHNSSFTCSPTPSVSSSGARTPLSNNSKK